MIAAGKMIETGCTFIAPHEANLNAPGRIGRENQWTSTSVAH